MSHRIDTPDPLWDPEQQIAALREQVARLEGELAENNRGIAEFYRRERARMSEIMQERDTLATRCESAERSLEISRNQTKDAFERIALTHNQNLTLATRYRELEAAAEGSNPDTDLDF